MFSLLLTVHVYLVALSFSFADVLAQPQAWGLLLGSLTPLLVSVLKQPGIPEPWLRPLALLIAGVVGVITVLSTGQFNPGDVITTLALVIVASQTFYSTVWKPSGVAASVEEATNLRVLERRYDDSGDDYYS